MRPDYLSRSRNDLTQPAKAARPVACAPCARPGGALVGASTTPNSPSLAASMSASMTRFVEVGAISTLSGLILGTMIEKPLYTTLASGTLMSLVFGASELTDFAAAFGGSYAGARLGK